MIETQLCSTAQRSVPSSAPYERRDRKPINRAAHRIFARDNFAVVLPHGLARPTNAARFFRQIHINETHRFFFQQQIEHLCDVWLELVEIWLFVFTHECADCNAAHSEQSSLLRRRQCAGMPAGVAKIQTEIDSGKNKIDMPPMMRAERNAIGRCAVDAICRQNRPIESACIEAVVKQ